MVAGDVGVQREVLGDLAGGDAGGARVAGEEVDLAAGRVAEGVRDRADRRVELVCGEGFGRPSGLILPMSVVEIPEPWSPARPADMPEALDVQAALAAVEEPELRRSIVELGHGPGRRHRRQDGRGGSGRTPAGRGFPGRAPRRVVEAVGPGPGRRAGRRRPPRHGRRRGGRPRPAPEGRPARRTRSRSSTPARPVSAPRRPG